MQHVKDARRRHARYARSAARLFMTERYARGCQNAPVAKTLLKAMRFSDMRVYPRGSHAVAAIIFCFDSAAYAV